MPRPILETLHHLAGGTFLDEAADKLQEAVLSVDASGKSATVTLEITLRKATATSMAVVGKVKAKLPVDKPVEALLFPTVEGNLLTEDPRQKKLPLAPIAAAGDKPVAAVESALPVAAIQ